MMKNKLTPYYNDPVPSASSKDYFYDYVKAHIQFLGTNPDSFDWELQVEELRAQFMTPLEVAKRLIRS